MPFSNNSHTLPKTPSRQADDAFLQNLSPEIIAEQVRIMKQIEDQKRRGGRMAGTRNLERQELTIRQAFFC